MASTLTRLTSQPVHGGSGRAAYSRGSAQGKLHEQEAFFFHFKDSRGSLNSLCQHEKLSSQLQLSQKKPPAAESPKPEVKPPEAAAACEGATAKPPEDRMTGEVIVNLMVLFDETNQLCNFTEGVLHSNIVILLISLPV